MFKAKVVVALKDDVLDAGGRAVAERLRHIGYPEVKDAKLGKYIELHIETGDRIKQRERVHEMCKKLLSNPMIEEFEIVSADEEKQKKPS